MINTTEIGALLPLIAYLIGVSAVLWGMHWFLIGRHNDLGSERKFARQLVMLGLTLLGVLAVIMMLPISDSSRNRLLGLVGIVFSGLLAFSSASIFSNLAAGILLRITKPFKTGDFIHIGEHFGRVSERGLFDTEIQTEKRELVALPNTYCVSNPIRTTRSSGTIISASLSLGYDVSHSHVKSLLLKAANESGLDEPFVHIIELGDYAVTYQVSGLLPEPKFLLSARSQLHGCVLDILHAAGVEIMSPAYMNQRRLAEDHRVLPPVSRSPTSASPLEGSLEAVAFDKAERAGELEQEKKRLSEEVEKLKEARKQSDDEQRTAEIAQRIELAGQRLESIEKAIRDIKVEDERGQSDSRRA